MIEQIKTAVEQIDWRNVTLSRLRYGNGFVPVGLGDPHWLERPFAYEIYHQLRVNTNAPVDCVVQAEVLKTYQEIREIKKMPDLLFHVPDSGRNISVIEIKLASNTQKKLEDDLDKLALFRRVLKYELLVEILIGGEAELKEMHVMLDKLDNSGATPISILTLSLDSRRTDIRTIKFREVKPEPKKALL